MNEDESAHEARDGLSTATPPGAPDPERESWFRRWVVIPFQGLLLVGLLVAALSSPFVVGWTLISRGVRGTWLWDAPSLFGIAGVLALLFWRLDWRPPHRRWVRRAGSVFGWVCACLAVPTVLDVLLKPMGTGTLVLMVLMGVVIGYMGAGAKDG